eukprot:997603-Amphidinium_carterae.1
MLRACTGNHLKFTNANSRITWLSASQHLCGHAAEAAEALNSSIGPSPKSGLEVMKADALSDFHLGSKSRRANVAVLMLWQLC